MTDNSSLDMSNASLVSSQQLDDNQHTEGSTFSSIPSLPSLDADVTRILSDDFEQQELEELLSQKHSPLRGDPISLTNSIQHNNIPINNNNSNNNTNNSGNNNYTTDHHENTDSNNNSNNNNNNNNNRQQPTYKPSFQHIVTGHIRSFSIVLSRFMFKDNNLTLLLNIIGHLLAARQLWGKPKASVARYTNIITRTSSTINNTNVSSSSSLSLSSSAITTLMMDQFRGMGVLHLALGCLAALALKERRLSTERTALWVLAISSWGQSYVQAKAYLTSPSLYTLNALRELGTLNGLLTIITSIALRNTIRRTGRIL